MRIAVYRDGSVVATSPFGVERQAVEKFVAEKRKWILDKIRFFKGVNEKNIRTFSYGDYLENKDKALALVNERIGVYDKIYGFSFNKIDKKVIKS